MYEHQGGHFFGWVFGFLFLALVVGLVVYFVFWVARGHNAPLRPAGPASLPPPDDPLAIVRLRYARGEMSRDEFLRANEDLGRPPVPSGAAQSPPQ